LLKGARPVFDKDGEWIKRTRVAFIVINFLGSRLLDKPFENGEPSEKFKEILTETTKALIARPDAIPLGYAWLQRLFMSPGRTRRRPGMRDDGNLPTALILVAANLAPHLGPHPSPLKWIEAELYVWRNWRIYALLAVEICRQPVDRNAIATLVTQVLLNDLASSVGLDHLGSGPNIERRIIGNAIVQIPDLATWFADLWKRLFWQRVTDSGGCATTIRRVRILVKLSCCGGQVDWSFSMPAPLKPVRFGSNCTAPFVKAS
jgi:hypothetical protein